MRVAADARGLAGLGARRLLSDGTRSSDLAPALPARRSYLEIYVRCVARNAARLALLCAAIRGRMSSQRNVTRSHT